ncbi:hypothetical protein HMPREF9098_1473 [Kingella denitrificans ATCC 33394]|uniref:Uncharacterized protein n=1 Tax=Kingella denitrificans ATCC 33394 TaxID=888741 RepID=F0F039_9NEIS|nr:hypothetical protein HMPREF9098_1473 [Kingella denitrificans ATCC 33394]
MIKPRKHCPEPSQKSSLHSENQSAGCFYTAINDYLTVNLPFIIA